MVDTADRLAVWGSIEASFWGFYRALQGPYKVPITSFQEVLGQRRPAAAALHGGRTAYRLHVMYLLYRMRCKFAFRLPKLFLSTMLIFFSRNFA